ncbi:uncharacterized protein LOC143770508 isoform X2 [Ranitomeya variabilis]|uniref:uncharacterized protein LOC143770508 isoform X2 n=1 Tax=Ranitomeya variabilis TaxID=490064 RepID=UPI0040575328
MEMEDFVRLSKKGEGVSIGITIKIQICNIAPDEVRNPSSFKAILTNPPGPQTAKNKKKNKKKRRTKKLVIEQSTEQVKVIKDPSTETEIVIPVPLSTEEEGTKEASTGKVEATMDQNNEHVVVIKDPLTKKEVVVPARLSIEEEGSEKFVMEPSTEHVEITMDQNYEKVDVIKDPPPKTEIDVPVCLSIEEKGVFIDIKIKGIQHFNFTNPPVNNPSPSKEISTNPVGHHSSKKKKRRTKRVAMKPSTGQLEAKLDKNYRRLNVIKKGLLVLILLMYHYFALLRSSLPVLQSSPRINHTFLQLPASSFSLPPGAVPPGIFTVEIPVFEMIAAIVHALDTFNKTEKRFQALKKIYKFFKDILFRKKDGGTIASV